MLLQLDDQYKVTCDSSKQNFILEKLVDVIDKKSREVVRKEYQIIGYHGNSFRSVLKKYAADSLIESEPSSYQQVIDKLNDLERTIDRVVKRENIKLEVKSDD